MINFIKRATSIVVSPNCSELYNGLTCAVFSIIQEDKKIETMNKEIFSITTIARHIKSKFTDYANKELSESTPLDYAALYEKIGGNPLVFLNNYQNYIGPIE